MTEQMTALGRPATTPPRIFYLWLDPTASSGRVGGRPDVPLKAPAPRCSTARPR